MVKQILAIVRRNLISPLTLSILVLAITLFALGERRDAWFVSFVIVVNSVFGCVQEIRALLILRKIDLMAAPWAKVFRQGEVLHVPFQELKVGDKILLRSGDEIPADCKVLSPESFEVVEAMLTGESSPIKKKSDDHIWASSSVVSGESTAIVRAVGDQTKAGQIAKKLKNYKPILTPLQKRIQHAISFLTYLALALALLIFIDYSISGEEYVVIIRTITSAAVTVVPEGLLLASSMFFTYGSIKLARAKVLPQNLSASESMALLDVLATDKTGTLTSPKMMFDNLEILVGDQPHIEHILYTFSQETGVNSTSQALAKQYRDQFESSLELKDAVAFSSSRKMSAIQIAADKGESPASYVLGAPEYIMKSIAKNDEFGAKVENLAAKGLRVLLLAKFKKSGQLESDLENYAPAEALAIVCLKNQLRPKVAQSVDFLQKRGISIRVISGDNPKTVSYVARQAGIKNPDNCITGEELSGMNKADFETAALDKTIFARVLPEQKEAIIRTLKKAGFYTGMIGDGVNDALSIKESHLGIAMHDGSSASRRVADLILLNNSFAALPGGIKVGNQILQSIEIIAMLFFNKIIIGITILLTTMLMGVNYPFLPRHVTFINFILVTLPTILITFFPFVMNRKINPRHFWKDTFVSILPISIMSGVTVSVIYWAVNSWNMFAEHIVLNQSIATIAVIAMAFFGAMMVYISSLILGARFSRRTRVGAGIYIVSILAFISIVFSVSIVREFFDFNLSTLSSWLFVGFIVSTVAAAEVALAKLVSISSSDPA